MTLLHWVLTAMFALTAGVQPGATIDEFRVSDMAEKTRILNGIAVQSVTAIEPTELSELLRLAINDESAQVRKVALMAVASRRSGPRFNLTNTVVERWRVEYAVLQPLRGAVAASLRDSDGGVRHAAIVALGAFDYEGPGTVLRDLHPETMAALLAVPESDPDRRVRQEVLKCLALVSSDSPAIRARMIAGLGDATPGVRRFALLGLGRVRPIEALNGVEASLQDVEPSVRAAAAKAAAAYGPAAAALLRGLQAALDREEHAMVRVELRGALERVTPR